MKDLVCHGNSNACFLKFELVFVSITDLNRSYFLLVRISFEGILLFFYVKKEGKSFVLFQIQKEIHWLFIPYFVSILMNDSFDV